MSPLLTNFRVCASRLVSTSSTAGLHARSTGHCRRLTRLHGIALACLIGLAVAGVAVAENYHSNPWLLSWIPAACCVTNDCCWEVQESELRPLPGDRWEVISTGQVRRRTDWSPDGKFYRCACDYTGTTWIKHQGANTRCLFVPLRSASR